MSAESPGLEAILAGKYFYLNDQWLTETAALGHIARQNHVAYSLWDETGKNFIFFSDKYGILGALEPGVLTGREGLNHFLSRVHPSYIKAMHLMYQKSLCFCTQHPQQMQETQFYFDVLYSKNEKENVQLLLQAIVLEKDSNHQPVLFLNSIYDITHLKKENTANLVVVEPNQTELWNYSFDSRKLEPVKQLTAQEKNVLHLLSHKKCSKEIAALLNTSSHTIDTHRRSLLHKTNCVDCTALITYARMTGLIS